MKNEIPVVKRCIAFLLLAPVLAFAQIDSRTEFSRIDKHALEAPAEAEQSFETLARYLVAPARSDKEKIRALFRWIVQNISYDTESFFSGELSAVSAETALKEKKAVCDGYAGLFEQMAKTVQIEVEKISGYSKGYGFVAGGRVDERPNHAWNAVKIDGTWHLLDCTWGAGYLNEQKQFTRNLQEHYFLTPPEEFIYDHFPSDAQWQLLSTPVSREQYENFVYLRPAFFLAGLKLKSHTSAAIRAQKELSLTIEAPSDALVLATLNQGEKKLEDSRIFSQRSSKSFEIRCSFPGAGAYILRLFAKRKTDSGSYWWALDYRVDCEEGSMQRYPKAYSMFTEKDCFLYTPLNGVLEDNTVQEFRIKVAEAEKVAVIQAGKWTYLTKKEDEFSGIAPVVKGELQLAAKFPNQESFQTLLSFSGQ